MNNSAYNFSYNGMKKVKLLYHVVENPSLFSPCAVVLANNIIDKYVSARIQHIKDRREIKTLYAEWARRFIALQRENPVIGSIHPTKKFAMLRAKALRSLSVKCPAHDLVRLEQCIQRNLKNKILKKNVFTDAASDYSNFVTMLMLHETHANDLFVIFKNARTPEHFLQNSAHCALWSRVGFLPIGTIEEILSFRLCNTIS